ncbi:MAG: fructosamine kinase family protein, partial [Phormidesmis sp.]
MAGPFNKSSSGPLSEPLAKTIAAEISQITGRAFQVETQRSVSGGCINQAVQVSQGSRSFFVKLNRADQLAMFEAERDGLQEMVDSRSIRVPQPLSCGVAVGSAYIVMEWLELGGSRSNGAWQQMGQQLAAMHNSVSEQGFGWHRDNTIGSTPQKNGWVDNWVGFWRDR